MTDRTTGPRWDGTDASHESGDRLHRLRRLVLEIRALLEGAEAGAKRTRRTGSSVSRAGTERGDLWQQLRAAPHPDDNRPTKPEPDDVRDGAGVDEPGEAEDQRARGLVAESARFWANRLLTLRCLEARGLVDEVIIRREAYGGRSLRHHRLMRSAPARCIGDDDGLYEAIDQVSAEIATALPSLFAAGLGASLLRPSAAALDRVVALLGGESAPSGVPPADDDLFRDPTTLAWSYQFWNAERKDRIFERLRNSRGHRLEAAEIPAATQLYTDRTLVQFVLQNTIGARWASWHPRSPLIDGWPLLVRGAVVPSARPGRLEELTLLDPACGSGHFLLEAFDMLLSMYEEEGTLGERREMARTILERNLWGLDVDSRAIQTAEALLWMRAAERCHGLEPVAPNLAVVDGQLARWVERAIATLGGSASERRLADRLGPLASLAEVGSLAAVELSDADLAALRDALPERRQSRTGARAGAGDCRGAPLEVEDERSLAALRRLSFVSSHRFDVVATNPPYAGFRLLSPAVKRAVLRWVPDTALDIYVAFISRFFDRLAPGGRLGVVCPASWTTSSHTAPLRERILRDGGPVTVAALGQGVFDTAPLLFVCLAVVERASDAGPRGLVPLSPPPRSGAAGLEAAVRRPTERWSWELVRGFEGSPFLPAAPPALLATAADEPTVGDHFTLVDGIWSGSSDRDVREAWELPRGALGWCPVSGGQGYSRWYAPTHRRTRADAVVRSARGHRHPLRAKLEYARVAGGKLAARFVPRRCTPADTVAQGSAPRTEQADEPVAALAGIVRIVLREGSEPARVEQLAAVFNSRVGQLWLRTLTSGLNFNPGYAARVPLRRELPPGPLLGAVRKACELKQRIARAEPTGDDFDLAGWLPRGGDPDVDLLRFVRCRVLERLERTAELLECEAEIERLLADHLELPESVRRAVDDALGPLAASLPDVPSITVPTSEPAGGDDASADDGERVTTSSYPADSSLEQSARRGAVHPRALLAEVRAALAIDSDEWHASVHTKTHDAIDGRRQGSRASLGALARELLEREAGRVVGDYLTFVVLGLDLAGRQTTTCARSAGRSSAADDPWSPWGDAWEALGILPLQPVGEWPGVASLARARIHSDFPGASRAKLEHQASVLLGCSLDAWLRQRFFAWHARRLARRPVIWQLQSRRCARPAFACWLHAHRVDADTLPKIAAHLVGPLERSWRADLDELRATQPTGRPSRRAAELASRLAELESFAARLAEVAEYGFRQPSPEGPRGVAMAREEPRLRSTPERVVAADDDRYAPRVDHGVRVNIAPLQRFGLLGADVLAAAQVARAIEDRATWLAQERARLGDEANRSGSSFAARQDDTHRDGGRG